MLNLAAMLPVRGPALLGRISFLRPPVISRADRQALADALMQALAKALRGVGLESLPAGAVRRPDAQRFVQDMLCDDPGFAWLYRWNLGRTEAHARARRLIRQRGWVHAFLNEYLVNHAPAQLFALPRRAGRALVRAKALPQSSFEWAEKLFAAVHADGSVRHVGHFLGGMVARHVEAGYLRNGDALRMSHVLNGLGHPIPWTPGGTVQGDGQANKGGVRHYFYRVPDLVEHMKVALGKPLCFAPPTDGLCHGLKGRKGIVFFRHNLSDVIGHVRLWNGEGMAGGTCRFGAETEILFWPLGTGAHQEKAAAGSRQAAMKQAHPLGEASQIPLLTHVAGHGAPPSRILGCWSSAHALR